MKIYFHAKPNSFLESISRAVSLEGDEVLSSIENPELTITDSLALTSRPKVFLGYSPLPKVTLDALGVEIEEEKRGACSSCSSLWVSRWFDLGFREQTTLGIPLTSLMTQDLGPRCISGLGQRFIHSGPLFDLFDNESLKILLSKMSYNGLVTFELQLFEGQISILNLSLGSKVPLIFNLLEGVKSKISDFLSGENSSLLESWTTSLVLSVAPWPRSEASFSPSQRTFIKGLSPALDKHLWLWGVQRERKSVYSDLPLLGVSSAWAQTLTESNRRALRTLFALDIKEKQFRTDLASSVASVYHDLTTEGLVEV